MIGWALLTILALPARAAVPCLHSVGDRSSPCMPSKAERKQIMDIIKSAIKDYGEYVDARQKEEEAREADKRGEEVDREEWSRQLDRMKRKESAMHYGFANVIRSTQEYYGISPTKKLGEIGGRTS